MLPEKDSLVILRKLMVNSYVCCPFCTLKGVRGSWQQSKSKQWTFFGLSTVIESCANYLISDEIGSGRTPGFLRPWLVPVRLGAANGNLALTLYTSAFNK